MLGTLGEHATAASELLQSGHWAARLVLAALIALLGLWLSRLLSNSLDRVLVRFEVDPILRAFLRNLAHAIGVVVVFIAALDAAGVPTHSLLAVVGAAGLAIGLALKDSLSNIAAGVMLIVLRPFRAGDHVQVAGLEGQVEQVRVFQSVLLTTDHRTLILPNSQIIAAPIINYTARGTRRVDLSFLVRPEDEPQRVRRLLVELAGRVEGTLAEPAPEVVVIALGDRGLELQWRVWVPSRDYSALRYRLLEAAGAALGEAGVRPPPLTRELHVMKGAETGG
jgi:small-conductance mechanosensitive channel